MHRPLSSLIVIFSSLLAYLDLKVENILFTSPCVRHADGMYLPTSNRIKCIAHPVR